MRGLASSAFVVVLIAWAIIDLPSLIAVSGALFNRFVILVQTIADIAESKIV